MFPRPSYMAHLPMKVLHFYLRKSKNSRSTDWHLLYTHPFNSKQKQFTACGGLTLASSPYSCSLTASSRKKSTKTQILSFHNSLISEGKREVNSLIIKKKAKDNHSSPPTSRSMSTQSLSNNLAQKHPPTSSLFLNLQLILLSTMLDSTEYSFGLFGSAVQLCPLSISWPPLAPWGQREV